MSSPDGSPASFPQRDRIRKRSEYLLVQEGGRKLSTPSFVVFVRSVTGAGRGVTVDGGSSAHLSPPRFGITVTKKIGGAVMRNRIRRLVREAVRRHKVWFPAGLAVVFVAKRPAVTLSYGDLERELETFCTRFFARS